MRLVSIGDQVVAGTFPFHSRFNHVVNFVHGDRLVSVADETVGDGPLNIVLQGFVAGLTEAPLDVSANAFRFDSEEFRFSPRHRYRSTIRCRIGPRFRSNLDTFRELLVNTSPTQSLSFLLDSARLDHFRSEFEQNFVAQVRRSVNDIFNGDRLAGVRMLSGCGLGLTPSGDDFLAGHLIGLHCCGVVGHDIIAVARSNNIFSNTFLDLAGQGRLFGRMKDLILALMNGGEAMVRKSTEKLFAVGATSGADLGTGFYMTVRAS